VQINRRFLYLGLFFLVFGGVLLAARQGWISDEVVASLWQLWPVLLIAIGLSIILAGRVAGWVGGAIVSICLGAMAASVVQGGFIPFVGCGGGETGTPFETQEGELATSAEVDITFSCGELSVVTGSGSAWSVSGSSSNGRVPDIERSDGGVSIESAARSFPFSSGRETWTVRLPSEPTLDVGVTLNAGSGTAELDGAKLQRVSSTVNAGTLTLDLRGVTAIDGLSGTVNAGSSVTWLPDLAVEGSITVNAGSLVICAPEGIGLRLNTGTNPISSNDFDRAGLVQVDGGWETPDYDAAAVQSELNVTANAGSMSLNPSQPCSTGG
jgi:cell wall-active antibiotic response 4TMS protein YvqF